MRVCVREGERKGGREEARGGERVCVYKCALVCACVGHHLVGQEQYLRMRAASMCAGECGCGGESV